MNEAGHIRSTDLRMVSEKCHELGELGGQPALRLSTTTECRIVIESEHSYQRKVPQITVP